MYLGVDIGGTKTLLALFDKKGDLQKSFRFPTPNKYDEFLQQVAVNVDELSTTHNFGAVCVAVPGSVNRDEGILISAGNLGWKNISVQADFEGLFKCPALVENDAKLAGLSEAIDIIKDYKKVLYITISTGIGIALVVDGIIDVNVGDRGGRSMFIERMGKSVTWESFASGKAIVHRYGMRASDITDKDTWSSISQDIAVGLIELVAVLEPEIIVIGGGVGQHFEKFEKPLKKAMKTYETPLMPIPPIKEAKRAEEAVIYGCYEFIKGKLGVKH